MPKRVPEQFASISRRQINGRFGDLTFGGGEEMGTVGAQEGQVVSNALLVVVNLVDTSGVAVDGTTTHVDNIELEGGEIILRAAGIGTGGHVDNGLWLVGDDPDDPWTRHRPDLHRDGLLILIAHGAAAVSTATAPNVPHGGMRESMWKLISDAPFVLDVDPIEFRQMPILDAAKFRRATSILGYAVGTVATAVPLTYTGVTPGLTSLYMTSSIPAAGALKSLYSGLSYVDFCIKCSHVSASGILAAGIWKNGVLEQEIIARTITMADERHHGASLVRVAGDNLDTLDIRLYDPAGVGFAINIIDYYTDIILGARR